MLDKEKDTRLLKRLSLTNPDNEFWKRKTMIAELREKEIEKSTKKNTGIQDDDQNCIPKTI